MFFFLMKRWSPCLNKLYTTNFRVKLATDILYIYSMRVHHQTIDIMPNAGIPRENSAEETTNIKSCVVTFFYKGLLFELEYAYIFICIYVSRPFTWYTYVYIQRWKLEFTTLKNCGFFFLLFIYINLYVWFFVSNYTQSLLQYERI